MQQQRFLQHRHLLRLVLPLSLVSCAVGPNYHRPDAPTPTLYHEAQGWKPATPGQASSNVAWWSIYNDPQLDALERQVDVSNQNLKVAQANYLAARAAVGVDRGSLLPTVDLTGSGTRSGGALGAGGTGGAAQATTAGGISTTGNTYSVSASGSWDIDVWGRIRRTVESDVANAQASAADIAAARLSAQTTLAQDYFDLRAADEEKRLLATAIEAYKTSLQITQNRVKGGVTTVADVYTARTQLENAQAQDVGVDQSRDQYEHAIAVLIGKPPADFALAPASFPSAVPVVPAGMPSSLLERRPDISVEERTMAAANAKIGVAEAAWFPSLTLDASYGFTSTALKTLFSAGTSFWSVGPELAETVFNGGARSAQTQEAKANYAAAVATYRQTVLTAFQQVEDDLASLRVLQDQWSLQNSAVMDARLSEELTLNQYKAGVADYSSVITAQTTRLTDEISLLTIQSERLVASVSLVTALGGGWSDAQLPQPGRFYSLDKTVAETPPAATNGGATSAAPAAAPER